MKRINQLLVSLSIFVVATANVNGQGINAPSLDLKIPAFEKVITVTGSNVNMRKAPSVKAPRLMFSCYNESDICEHIWSNQKSLGYSSPCMADKGDVFTVLAETVEWYKCEFSDNIIYLSKKFAKATNTTPITSSMFTKADYYNFEVLQKPAVMSSQYNGYVIINQNGFDTDGYAIGRIVDGYLVTVNCPNVNIEFDDNVARVNVVKTDDGYCLKFGRGVSFLKDGFYFLDMTKLNDTEVAYILALAGVETGKTINSGSVYACVNGKLVKILNYDYSSPDFKVARIDKAPRVVLKK